MQYNTNRNSSWWLGDSFFDKNVDILTGEEIKDKSADLIKLAGYRRAIANFVNIVTGENVPVTFKGNDSYTDGKSVVLSASLKDKDFDAAVGLALHEGSHIKLTDFDILKDLLDSSSDVIPKNISIEYGKKHCPIDTDLDNEIEYWGRKYIVEKVKALLNIVEDRRIDNFIFKSAPGYKGYYHALYEKYFNAKIVDKGLLSDEYRNPDWDSYMFRICNITNENRDLNALPGLSDIWKAMDLANIGNIKSTAGCLDIAFKIFHIVEKYIAPPQKTSGKDGEEDQDCQGEKSCSSSNGSKEGKTPEGGAKDDGSKAKGGEVKSLKSLPPVVQGNGPLSPAQLKKLKNAIKKQENFVDGEIKKTRMTNADKKKVKAIEESGSEIKNVGTDVFNPWDRKKTAGTQCIVIKKLTKNLIDSNMYSFLGGQRWSFKSKRYSEPIAKGVRLGTLLGKKLKLRSEERNTKFSRLDSGKIDKRLIASLGFGATRIFEQVMTDKYVPANVHISIDNSGSMSGNKFANCQTAVVAIAKAASMIDNLDIQISYRTTSDHKPIILIAYDSRVDSFKKIQTLFPHICPSALTPEGLTFEAIQNSLVEASGDKESYFINFSDGEPYCAPKGLYYGGQPAEQHTKAQVEKMRKKGIKVLSYFINDRNADQISRAFKAMYGQSAANVDVTNLLPLAKTLNKLFLKK